MDYMFKLFWEMMAAVIVVIIVMTVCFFTIDCVCGRCAFIF